jgi:hypothetical protein
MNKIAVDKSTQDYWSDYFKEYGKMWVRDIPRRVKAAMRLKVNATKVEGKLAPMAASINEGNDTLSVEAAFIGEVDDKEATILVTAEFDSHGEMLNIEAFQVI